MKIAFSFFTFFSFLFLSFPLSAQVAIEKPWARATAPGANVAGGSRTYQTWYRNAPPFCTTATFNLTNALRLTWLP